MARKKAESLQEGRIQIKDVYFRGTRQEKRVASLDALDVSTIAYKRAQAVLLKAADFSTGYIAQACGVSKGVVRTWYQDEEWQAEVAKFRGSLVEGAIELLRAYAVELIEMLVNLARTTSDDKVALSAIEAALDRMGLTKVNKSESATTNINKSQVDLTDSTGLIEALKDAPPEIQQKAAEHMESMMALAAEHLPTGSE